MNCIIIEFEDKRKLKKPNLKRNRIKLMNGQTRSYSPFSRNSFLKKNVKMSGIQLKKSKTDLVSVMPGLRYKKRKIQFCPNLKKN
jgi:hypothetical protein